MALICGSDKAKYFSQIGLTRIRESHLSGKSLASRSVRGRGGDRRFLRQL
jgi:hypothetical protein